MRSDVHNEMILRMALPLSMRNYMKDSQDATLRMTLHWGHWPILHLGSRVKHSRGTLHRSKKFSTDVTPLSNITNDRWRRYVIYILKVPNDRFLVDEVHFLFISAKQKAFISPNKVREQTKFLFAAFNSLWFAKLLMRLTRWKDAYMLTWRGYIRIWTQLHN